MSAARKLRRLKAANDGAAKKSAPLVSVITLAPNPKSIKRMMATSVLLTDLGLMGLSIWAMQKTTEPLDVAPRTASSLPQKFTDIRLPASSLSPDTVLSDDPEVQAVAAQIGTMPALKSKSSVHNVIVDSEPVTATHDLVAEARALLDTADYAPAIDLYDQTLASHPRDHDALTGKIYAWAKNGEIDNAVTVSRSLISLYPHDHAAAVNLARLLTTNGKNDEALAVLDHAVRANPDNLNYRLDLAAAYDRNQHPAEALMLYQQIIRAAEDRDDTRLPLRSIERRIDYLEKLAGASPEPSTTLPVDN